MATLCFPFSSSLYYSVKIHMQLIIKQCQPIYKRSLRVTGPLRVVQRLMQKPSSTLKAPPVLSRWQTHLERQISCSLVSISVYVLQMTSFHRIPLLGPSSSLFSDSLHSLKIHLRKVQIPESMGFKDLGTNQFCLKQR